VRVAPGQSQEVKPTSPVRAEGIAILAAAPYLRNQILYVRVEIQNQEGLSTSVTLPVYEWAVGHTSNTQAQVATFPIQADTPTGQVCLSRASFPEPLSGITKV
jgi:hypothetical protein